MLAALDSVAAHPLPAPGTGPYPRRLIEADLPMAAISQSAREGRTVHHGHITAIHLWWARKPLASCRATVLSALLLDPTDPLCPPGFRIQAADLLRGVYGPDLPLVSPTALRDGLLRLVADCASWRFTRDEVRLEAARALVRAAHQAIHGHAAPPPLCADPFAGGGSIPLEALRLGCSAHAADLNPVATLLCQVTLDAVQRFGEPLLTQVEDWGARVAAAARERLSSFYPTDPDGAVPIAYLWFRALRCEGPACGALVPLASKFLLRRDGSRSVGLRLDGWDEGVHEGEGPGGARPRFVCAEGPLSSFPAPTVRRGAATCLRCGHTTPVEHVRAQLSERRGGTADALMLAVATVRPGGGRGFRTATEQDHAAARAASSALAELCAVTGTSAGDGGAPRGLGPPLAPVPDEPLPPIGTIGFRVQRYGMLRWRDLFTPRQLLTLATLTELVRDAVPEDQAAGGIGAAVRACLALCVDRLCDYLNSGCSWNPSGGALPHLFTRQALPIIWDFGEANPFGGSAGDFAAAVGHVLRGLRNAVVNQHVGVVAQASASRCPLPSDYAPLLVTDPPYYDAIPYADLSDFFYVWLRRMLHRDHPVLFAGALAPRDEECIVNRAVGKDRAYFRRVMTAALAEARRVTRPDGLGVIIFAHKSTAGWEDLLGALCEAGWIITASWPIDTENARRLRARGSAVLASSIHLVCRPRERPDGTLIEDTVGEWRDVLDELPQRVHERMERLWREGIVGADALFACLGPALELFSRYARVEKSSGEAVSLTEFLGAVWAAVARAALSLIFEGAAAEGLEPDARLTALWLWTLGVGRRPSTPQTEAAEEAEEDGADDGAEEVQADSDDAPRAGYALEFDAARKIAIGLGVNLDRCDSLVEVRGDVARLLPVGERVRSLFGAEPSAVTPRRQLGLFGGTGEAGAARSERFGALPPPRPAATVLDRLHQAMILFGAGHSEGLRQLLAEQGVGRDARLWQLGLSLSLLYPAGSEEKRWIDGVLGRRQGLGL